MIKMLGIDPGFRDTAFCEINDFGFPEIFGKYKNELFLGWLIDRLRVSPAPVVGIEMIQNYGRSVGKETFETCLVIGRLLAEVPGSYCLYRPDIKRHHAHTMNGGDSAVRLALIDRYGGKPAIRKGGALYGISKDVWSALAVALAIQDDMPGIKTFREHGIATLPEYC